MTEDELTAMQTEVLSTPMDEAVDSEWRQQTLANLHQTEQKAMAEWKLSKFLRDDATMKKLAEDLKRIRSAQTFVRAGRP